MDEFNSVVAIANLIPAALTNVLVLGCMWLLYKINTRLLMLEERIRMLQQFMPTPRARILSEHASARGLKPDP